MGRTHCLSSSGFPQRDSASLPSSPGYWAIGRPGNSRVILLYLFLSTNQECFWSLYLGKGVGDSKGPPNFGPLPSWKPWCLIICFVSSGPIRLSRIQTKACLNNGPYRA